MTEFKLNRQQACVFITISLLFFLVSAACFSYRPVIITRMGNFTSSGGLSSTQSAQFVQDVVAHNCVVIFSKTTCPYCKMAKSVFNEIGATYKVIELDEHNDGRQLQEALAQMTGARTVPRVFINGQCIGGGSDTRQLHQQGKLLPLIEKCKPCCLNSGPEGSGSEQYPSSHS